MTTKSELTEEKISSEFNYHSQHWAEASMNGVSVDKEIFSHGMKAGYELGQKSTKTTDTPAELITGEELLDQFNSQSGDISSYVTLTEFIDRELQKAYELGRKGQRTDTITSFGAFLVNHKEALILGGENTILQMCDEFLNNKVPESVCDRHNKAKGTLTQEQLLANWDLPESPGE